MKQIIDERNNKYLIEWEDDEETGQSYENTWEPKRNANKLAVADWEERKQGMSDMHLSICSRTNI